MKKKEILLIMEKDIMKLKRDVRVLEETIKALESFKTMPNNFKYSNDTGGVFNNYHVNSTLN